jgi:hypothetical protein
LIEKVPTPTPETQIPSPKLSPETANDTTQMIEVIAPTALSVIASPLTVTGRARGPWYFEGSFPVELIDDATSLPLAVGMAQAQGEWMTENWVPFSVVLTFAAQPSGNTGKLILRNDNPSGLPENEMSVVIPVKF